MCRVAGTRPWRWHGAIEPRRVPRASRVNGRGRSVDDVASREALALAWGAHCGPGRTASPETTPWRWREIAWHDVASHDALALAWEQIVVDVASREDPGTGVEMSHFLDVALLERYSSLAGVWSPSPAGTPTSPATKPWRW